VKNLPEKEKNLLKEFIERLRQLYVVAAHFKVRDITQVEACGYW